MNREPTVESRESIRLRVAILGVGLIGGSIGMALRASGNWSVVGWDRDESATRVGIERGALDVRALTSEEATAHADLVVLAAPVSCTESLLESSLPALLPHSAVTDVGSTKARIVAAAEHLIGGRFVGGHPMAGSEKAGVANSDAGLFQGAAWLITPTENTEAGAIALVCNMAESCGALPRICTPEEHDRLVGVISHLPHLLAFGLAQTAADFVPIEWRSAAGASLRDGTRVAASSPDLWADILMDNRAAILPAMAVHNNWMARALVALEARDRDTLLEILTHARAARAGFPPCAPPESE